VQESIEGFANQQLPMIDRKRILEVALLWLHTMSIFVACALIVLAFIFRDRTTNTATPNAVLTAKTQMAIAVIAVVGVLSGLGNMATRSGANESIGVAASTILALFLLFFAC
jgi:hypothetical protein